MKKMNCFRLVLTGWLLAGGLFAEPSSAGTDAAVDPGSFEIKDYSPKTGIVKILCGSISTNRPFDSFSETEQREITSWLMDKRFKSMKITLDQKVKRESFTRGEEQDKYTGEIRHNCYEITLETGMLIDVDDITLEYWIFYKTRDGVLDKTPVDKKRVKTGRQKLRVPANEARVITTETVSIRDLVSVKKEKKRKSAVFDKDQLFGIHVSITRTDRNGNVVTLEKAEGNIPPKSEWGEFTP
ncbi:MAG: hypothetical protein MUC65_01010 [Pontiellaceae bacterium]|jgi:hypothetical protein|nr:hypothetical protein [Pontiellaceae bacterium]